MKAFRSFRCTIPFHINVDLHALLETKHEVIPQRVQVMTINGPVEAAFLPATEGNWRDFRAEIISNEGSFTFIANTETGLIIGDGDADNLDPAQFVVEGDVAMDYSRPVMDEITEHLHGQLKEQFDRVHRQLMSEGTGISVERLNELHSGATPTKEETYLTAKYLFGEDGAASVKEKLDL